jgi:acyl-CoA reductase-like NAD-dependent aldehyde dehydrogenase
MELSIPKMVPNWVNGSESHAADGRTIDKFNPASGMLLCTLARSTEDDIAVAVDSAARHNRFGPD